MRLVRARPSTQATPPLTSGRIRIWFISLTVILDISTPNYLRNCLYVTRVIKFVKALELLTVRWAIYQGPPASVVIPRASARVIFFSPVPAICLVGRICLSRPVLFWASFWPHFLPGLAVGPVIGHRKKSKAHSRVATFQKNQATLNKKEKGEASSSNFFSDEVLTDCITFYMNIVHGISFLFQTVNVTAQFMYLFKIQCKILKRLRQLEVSQIQC